jgi:tetratricopeptide (TPR) repeat protein
MASRDVSTPVPLPPAPPRFGRRRRFWLVLAVGLLGLGGLLAREGWGAWEEHSARKALAEERLDEAQAHVQQALRVWLRQVSTHVLAARIARSRGAYSEAEQYLSDCGPQNNLDDQVQLEWLLLRCQRGDVDELAPGLLARVENSHSESAAILEALATVYMRQTRYAEALRCLDRWIQLAPDCVRALDWRGWVSNQLDHRGQAISDYERALELQPSRSVVRLRLAEILVASARHPEALPHLEQLRDEQPTNPDVLVSLACCRVTQSRLDEAQVLLDTALAIHPKHFDGLLQRGKLELEHTHFAEAEHWLRKALERNPRDPEARYALYISLQMQRNRQRESLEELARWKEQHRKMDRLTRLLRTELDAHPRDPDLAAEAGELLLQMGEEQRGLVWLYRALALDPRHAASQRALAAYYERTAKPEGR